MAVPAGQAQSLNGGAGGRLESLLWRPSIGLVIGYAKLCRGWAIYLSSAIPRGAALVGVRSCATFLPRSWAERLAGNLLKALPDWPELLCLIARWRSADDAESAAALLVRALSHRPAYAPAHYELGRLAEQRGSLAEALASYARAAALQPALASAGADLRRVQEALGFQRSGVQAGRLFIVDRGWYNDTGHNYVVNKELLLECTARQQEVTIYANRLLPPRLRRMLGAQACLRGNHYWVRRDGPIDYLTNLGESRTFFRDLYTYLPSRFQPRDTVLLHTVTEGELCAVHEWYRSLGAEPPALRIILRWPPDGFAPELMHPVAIGLYAQVLKGLHRWQGGGVRFFADSPNLAEAFTSISGVPVRTVPLLLELPDAVLGARHPRTELNISFAGNSAASKGFHFLPEVVRRVSQDFPSTRFTIQCLGADPAVVAQLRAQGSGVTLIERSLHGADYHAFLGGTDILFAVYEPLRYRYATSHTVAEAASLGIPVITTSQTSMSVTLRRLGGGSHVEVARFELEDAVTGTLQMVAGYRGFFDEAQAVAKAWRVEHNAKSFVDILYGS